MAEVNRKVDHQIFVQEFLAAMEPDPDGVCEFIHYDALTNMCEGPDVPPLDNRPILCMHGRLNYEKVQILNLSVLKSLWNDVGSQYFFPIGMIFLEEEVCILVNTKPVSW